MSYDPMTHPPTLSLSELSQALGSKETPAPQPQTAHTKPLCQNIFDVERGNLYDVLQSLRSVFWAQPPPAVVVPPTETAKEIAETTTTATAAKTAATTTATTTAKEILVETLVDTFNTTLHVDPQPTGQETKRPTEKTKTHSARHKRRMSVPETPPQQLRRLHTKTTVPWSCKDGMMRELRMYSSSYKESAVLAKLAVWEDSYSAYQREQLALYLMPVARGFQRASVVQVLQRWC